MGLTSSQAWRVAFIVPFILITATFLGMIFFCQDTPTGKWSERHDATKHLLAAHGVQTSVLDRGSRPIDAQDSNPSSGAVTPRLDEKKTSGNVTPRADIERGSIHGSVAASTGKEIKMSEDEMLAVARGEIVVAPTFKEACNVFFSLQTAFHACTYICSFGGEGKCRHRISLAISLTIDSKPSSASTRSSPPLLDSR